MVLKPRGHQPHPHILLHTCRNFIIALSFVALALLIGMLGYKHAEGMSWIDAFLNASMILSGMGPASTMVTFSGKLFAGLYALFSGLAFIAIMAIILSPFVHQMLRKIHFESTHQRNQDV